MALVLAVGQQRERAVFPQPTNSMQMETIMCSRQEIHRRHIKESPLLEFIHDLQRFAHEFAFGKAQPPLVKISSRSALQNRGILLSMA